MYVVFLQFQSTEFKDEHFEYFIFCSVVKAHQSSIYIYKCLLAVNKNLPHRILSEFLNIPLGHI